MNENKDPNWCLTAYLYENSKDILNISLTHRTDKINNLFIKIC